MAEITVDMTYGDALFSAAKDVDKVDTIHEEGLGIVDVFDENPELYTLLVNPTVAAPRKKDIVKNVFGGRVSQEMENFLYVLIDKGRMRNFPRIVREYEKLLDEEQGFADGVVYSVIALNDERIERIEEQTSRLLNHNVKLRNETDASLIGGIKVMIDGKVIDASIRKRLEDLGSTLNR
jgi:ATP synthase, F1 delta subunit